MSDPTTCPVCRCAPCAYPHVCRYVEALAGFVVEHKARLAAVEARLPVVAPVIPCNGRRCACVEPTNKVSCAPCWAAECRKDGPGEPCRRVAPPPSAEPTFEQLVNRAGPVSPALPLVVPGVQHSTNVRIPVEPAPVAIGASVPDGCDCEFKDAGDCADQWRGNLNSSDEPSDERCLCTCHGASVLDVQVCPKCGGEVNHGYGLMGGGIGPYVFCAEDRCGFFAKVQDDGVSVSDAGEPRPGGGSRATVPVEPPKAETEEVDWAKFVPTEEIPEAIGGEEPEAGAVVASWSKRCRAGSVRRWVAGTEDPVRLAGQKRFHRAHYRLIRHADGRWADGFNPNGPCMSWCGHGVGRGVAGFCTPFCVERHEKRPVAKAETAQAAVFTTPGVVAEIKRMNDKLREQPAEPSAPVGFRVVGRSGPKVEQNDGDWIALARMVDGVALPSCTSTEPRRAWHAPSGPSTCRSTWDAGCYDILEPIVEPAAPPVAAKLSEEQLQASVAWARQWLRTAGCTPSEYRAFTATVMLADSAAELKQLYGAAMSDLGAVQKAGEQWCKIAEQRLQDIAALDTALDAARAENEALRKQLETRDARIAGLEASHREDVERAVREERGRCVAWHRMRGPGLILLPWKNVDEAIANGDPVPKVGG